MVTKVIGWLPTHSKTESFEVEDFGVDLNPQSVNPGSVSTPSNKQYKASNNTWLAFPIVDNSFPNPIVDVSVLGVVMALLKLRLTINNFSYTQNISSQVFTASWYISIDNGLNWVLRGTSTGDTGSSGSVNFDNLTAEINGYDLTDDLLICVVLNSTSGSANIDLGEMTVSIASGLKTKQ